MSVPQKVAEPDNVLKSVKYAYRVTKMNLESPLLVQPRSEEYQ